MVFGQADSKVRAWPPEVQRRITSRIQMVRPLVQILIVFFPSGYRIRFVDARRRKDNVPELGQSLVGGQIGKDCSSPRWSSTRHDCPVSFEPRNKLEGWTIRRRVGAIRSADFVRVLPCEQGGVIAHDC